MSYTALNHPKWMKTPAPWFIRGKNILLDKLVEVANKQKHDQTAVFLNFSKENVKYSTLKKDVKFVCIAICDTDMEYEKITKVWNMYGEMFDGVIHLDKCDHIFDEINKVIERKYGTEPSKDTKWVEVKLTAKVKL